MLYRLGVKRGDYVKFAFGSDAGFNSGAVKQRGVGILFDYVVALDELGIVYKREIVHHRVAAMAACCEHAVGYLDLSYGLSFDGFRTQIHGSALNLYFTWIA